MTQTVLIGLAPDQLPVEIFPPWRLFGGVSRVQLSSPELVVAPNATTVFVAFLTIPGSPGTHNASVRMVQEQVEFFGPTAQLVVNVIPQPNSAADWEAYE